jgi:hypothetical protein
MIRRRTVAVLATAAFAVAAACTSHPPAAPTAPSPGATAPDGSTLKASAPVAVSPVNDAQVDGSVVLTVNAATLQAGQAALQYRFEVFNDASIKVQDSGPVSAPSFAVTAPLDFGKRYTWHARAEYQGAAGPWSTTASFMAPAGGYNRPGELFDPLTNGQTVGEVIGPATFIPGRGIRLDSTTSYVRYLLPATITSGEFSMEVEGLRANAPGDKAKVFGMQEGTGDFITNRYRVDIQYRGTTGVPPNAITFRALYGSASDLSVRYEPPTATRMASARLLDPSTAYFWKWTWGTSVRLTVQSGGQGGATIYDYGMPAPNGSYAPSPQYAYLGAPVGRSGAESATIPGTIYRNVWIGNHARTR